jgi:hypothetical protein
MDFTSFTLVIGGTVRTVTTLVASDCVCQRIQYALVSLDAYATYSGWRTDCDQAGGYMVPRQVSRDCLRD